MAVCVGREGGQEKRDAMVVPGGLVVTHRDRMYKISAQTHGSPSCAPQCEVPWTSRAMCPEST